MEPVAHVRPGFVVLAIRRRWRTVVLGAVLGALAGAGAATTLSPTYASTASLFLNPIAGNPYQPEIGTSRSDQLVALQTEASLVATPEVGALALERSAVPLPDPPERNVVVNAPSNSQVLRVRYTAGTPEVATAGAQAFAEAYLEYRRLRATEANEESAEQLRQQIEATSAVMESTAAELATTPEGSSRSILLQQQLQVYSSQLAQLNLQVAEVLSAVPATGEVISPATGSPAPSGIPRWAVALAGLLGGAGVALLYVLAREHGDDRVHAAQELTGLGAGHPLATVPTTVSSVDLTARSPDGYRLLMTSLTPGPSTRTPVVCVVGSERSDAPAVVAAGLAAAAHRLGHQVALVGGDVPAPWTDARVVDVADLLAPEATVPTGPTVVRLGPDPGSAETFAMSAGLPDALVRARVKDDLVVLSGGAGNTALARRFVALADRTLVVGELGKDDFTELLDLVETLRQSGVEDLGVVAATPSGRAGPVRWRPVHGWPNGSAGTGPGPRDRTGARAAAANDAATVRRSRARPKRGGVRAESATSSGSTPDRLGDRPPGR